MLLMDIIRTALRCLCQSRLRLFLSLFGVIVGTAAILASGALVEGGRRAVSESLDSLGTNIVFIKDHHNWGKALRGGEEQV